MTAEELWKESGLHGEYEAWQFGEAPDKLADLVTEEHAFKEGEGDRSLAYWREVHESFLKKELASINRTFDSHTELQ